MARDLSGTGSVTLMTASLSAIGSSCGSLTLIAATLESLHKADEKRFGEQANNLDKCRVQEANTLGKLQMFIKVLFHPPHERRQCHCAFLLGPPYARQER